MTLTFELHLDKVNVNQKAIYLDQKLFCSKVIVTHTHTQPNALPAPLKWSIMVH